jgi:tRNA dimethylallyltransferase
MQSGNDNNAMQQSRRLIAIVGPTASGKSDLAVEAALFIKANAARFRTAGAEIVSADSRQIYKGMDIGSGKITKGEMRRIPHHCLDIASPVRPFSVVQYQRHAERAIRGMHRRNIVPLLCGGTGLYADAVVHAYQFPSAKPNPALRRELEKQDTEKLMERLRALDPRRAEAVDPHNRRRIIRSLEILMATNMPLADLQKKSPYTALSIGIMLPKEDLAGRIRTRLEKRMRKGMLAEIRRLHKEGVSWKKLEDFGLEYRYGAQFLQKKIGKDEMLALIQKESERYAKRQMTWFRRDLSIHWVSDRLEALATIEQFLESTL